MDNQDEEEPEGYLFGKIPYYKNPYADDGTIGPKIHLWTYATIVGVAAVLGRYKEAGISILDIFQ